MIAVAGIAAGAPVVIGDAATESGTAAFEGAVGAGASSAALVSVEAADAAAFCDAGGWGA